MESIGAVFASVLHDCPASVDVSGLASEVAVSVATSAEASPPASVPPSPLVTSPLLHAATKSAAGTKKRKRMFKPPRAPSQQADQSCRVRKQAGSARRANGA